MRGGRVRNDLEREYVEYLEQRLPHLRRLAALLCGDTHRADDIVQSAATMLYTKWRHVRAAENRDAYVRRVVINTFLKERRQRWSRVTLTDRMPDRPAVAGQPVDERLEVRAALRGLPSRQQAVLVLRFLCDLPVSEVAELLGCAEGTVKSQTSDALAALRRRLGDNATTETSRGGTR
jgi:RNA polymerase sigma-70 factor (sigma-E family)